MSSTENESSFRENINNSDHQFHHDIYIDCLDGEITIDEVMKMLSSVAKNKSCDLTGNVADFFIVAKSFIAPYLVKIFNYIYNTGVYQISWTKGVIVLIYKKGDKSDNSNYRGITLVNIVAKLLSLVLRNRINTWCGNENIYTCSNEQFGFRNNRSTDDCIFILHTIIQNVISHNSKLYCAFIDYEKAFDIVIHDALWIKLINSGLSCKMLTMIKSMYKLLFILFINNFKSCFDLTKLTPSDIARLSIYMLLFADDIALFTTDPHSLQTQLDCINN